MSVSRAFAILRLAPICGLLALTAISSSSHAGWLDRIRGIVQPAGSASAPKVPALPQSPRPYNFTGPARPSTLKADEYLSVWPTDSSNADTKVDVLKLDRATSGYSPRGWLDIQVNRFAGEDSISTPAVFEIPLGDHNAHKTMIWANDSLGVGLNLILRMKDEKEFRAAAAFLHERLSGYKIDFVYMKATPQDRYRTHVSALSITQADGTTRETVDPGISFDDHFYNDRRSMYRYDTPLNEGDDFLIAKISLYDLYYEPDPARPSSNRRRQEAYQGAIKESVMKNIFRQLAPYDLVFVYSKAQRDFLDAGLELSVHERTLDYVAADGNISRMSIYKNQRELSQAAQLSPIGSKDINNQIHYYHLAALSVGGHSRPVMIEYLPNAVFFYLRTASADEAQRLSALFSDFTEPVVLAPRQISQGSATTFERAVFGPGEFVVDIRFTMNKDMKGNTYVSPQRKAADAVAFFGKNFGLRLVAADFVTLSLADFDQAITSRLNQAPVPAIGNLRCGEALEPNRDQKATHP